MFTTLDLVEMVMAVKGSYTAVDRVTGECRSVNWRTVARRILRAADAEQPVAAGRIPDSGRFYIDLPDNSTLGRYVHDGN